MITGSNKFMEKYLKDTLGNQLYTDNNKVVQWLKMRVSWLIDSKARTRIELNKFLFNQLVKPEEELIKVANAFKVHKSYDERIIKIHKYVIDRLTYKSDKSNFNKTEYWADAYDTWINKVDDCDGFNALIYILARLSGIPSYLLFSCIGSTKSGGHYWCLYYSTKKASWYSIDGTYYPDTRRLHYRTPFKFNKNKYNSIWYLFNENYVFKPKEMN